MKLTILIAAMILAGCSGDPPVPPVNLAVATDSYCEIYKKLSWSPKDTPETVRGILNANARYDRACGTARVAAATPRSKVTP